MKRFTKKFCNNKWSSHKDALEKIKVSLENADAVVLGAGAGLSTSAGFIYSGKRFEKYFSDFEALYGFHDMYSGGFYPYKTLEEHWAYWSRFVWVNRYMNPPSSLYQDLFKLMSDKNYFVITTNVDHCFQKAGFDKKRLFYTQGDYGLFQCSEGTTDACRRETFDNKDFILKMVESQGWEIGESGDLIAPKGGFDKISHKIPSLLVPKCPHCGKNVSMNLRSDDTFVEDAFWEKAARCYNDFFLENARYPKKIVFLELGVGGNTPGIIKYPFWQMTAENPEATYICINKGEALAPQEIFEQSICVNADIGQTLKELIYNHFTK